MPALQRRLDYQRVLVAMIFHEPEPRYNSPAILKTMSKGSSSQNNSWIEEGLLLLYDSRSLYRTARVLSATAPAPARSPPDTRPPLAHDLLRVEIGILLAKFDKR